MRLVLASLLLSLLIPLLPLSARAGAPAPVAVHAPAHRVVAAAVVPPRRWPPLLVRRWAWFALPWVGPPAATSPEVAPLLRQLQGLAFGDDKLRLVRAAARAQRFSCEDIAQLMRTTSFPDEQIEIAAVLYPGALDPHNHAALLGVLALHADQDRLLARLLGRQHGRRAPLARFGQSG